MSRIDAQPPRLAQVILESLGADPEFRDTIIGDMNQEFAERVERFGGRAAQLWYYGEAFRAAPHLARNWFSSATWVDARQMLNVLGLAYVLTIMTTALVGFGGVAIWTTLLKGKATSDVVPLVFAGIVSTLVPVLAGFFAASNHKKAPGIASLMIGLAMGLTGLVMLALRPLVGARLGLGLWPAISIQLINIPILMFLTSLGGSIRAWRHRAA